MTTLFMIGLVLSGIIGVSLGLMGGGGSILTVPILVYLLGVEPHEAVVMSLAVVGATSLFGAFLHKRRNNVDLRAGLIFGGAGIVGAFPGSMLTKLVTPGALLLIFGLLMLVVAVSMIWRKQAAEDEARHTPHFIQALLAGFGVGVLTGFLGVGGGFLIVPGLVFFSGLAMKRAVGTSLLIIFLNCLAGLTAHIVQDGQGRFDWKITALVTLLALGGAIAGTIFSHKISAQRLRKAFAVLVLAVAAFLIVKNHAVIF